MRIRNFYQHNADRSAVKQDFAEVMNEDLITLRVPAPESSLRDLAKNASEALPRFTEQDPTASVKQFHDLLEPIFRTAELPILSQGHRAAASNALCAIIEACQASSAEFAQHAALDDRVWLRVFNIYLDKSDEAKGKSMRQMLLVLTGSITKNQSPRALELRVRASNAFLEIICARQDRLKVKPALQGLAHFLLRDVVSIDQLTRTFIELQGGSCVQSVEPGAIQNMFKAILAWVVHHDTSLSAGHLIKNFLLQARKLQDYMVCEEAGFETPLWIKPVVSMLHLWPDRMQEFKTHVFPHCFLPNIDEYLRFLSYLHFPVHVERRGELPAVLQSFKNTPNELTKIEEFQVLLAALETGKELTILRDSDYRVCSTIYVQAGAIYLPDDVFGDWMSHPQPDVRLAGMFLSVFSTSITRPLTGGVFKSLRQNLIHLHTDTDANYRREVHGYTQKLFDRLRASTATLSKGRARAKLPDSPRLPIPRSCFVPMSAPLRQAQEDPLLESLAFVVWYTDFLVKELRSTASYQRRITALQSLSVVLRSGLDPGIPQSYLSKAAQGQLVWAHGLRLANSSLIRLLLDLILDPFDDIRSTAVAVLQLCMLSLSSEAREATVSAMPAFMRRAEAAMLRTGRADLADGVARAYSLVFSLSNVKTCTQQDKHPSESLQVFEKLNNQLETTLQLAHQNLSEAVDGRPVHGMFAALRYIVDQDNFYATISSSSTDEFTRFRRIHDNIITSIESLWSCVHHILCADAPEGHVPDELEEDVSLDTKEILSYSWRGLKEASVLLRTIVTKASVGENDHALLSVQAFERLGQLCFTQLLELRHRGAFSTVSQTFAAFCRRCTLSELPAIRALPEIWYKDTLNSIHAKADAITRRSAGIPALMTAIVAADPKMFPRALQDLIAESLLEAKSTNIEESRLPQVHAMNCIKEFFTTSRLSGVSETHIGQGLELAARTLNSSIWPIRNCSLMLFKALIERLLGSDEAQDWKEQGRSKTSRFSYDSYPTLVEILKELLDSEGPLKQSIEETPVGGSPLDLHGAEGVFPALQILRQARPPQASLEHIIKSVEKLLSSPHWHLRDMAARTITSLRTTSQLGDSVRSLLAAKSAAHNAQHGSLLAIKHMLRKLLQDQRDDICKYQSNQCWNRLVDKSKAIDGLGDILMELLEVHNNWYTMSNCPFSRATFLDLINICGMSLLESPHAMEILHIWESLSSSVSIGPDYALTCRPKPENALFQQSLAQVFFLDRAILRQAVLGPMSSYEHQDIGEALISVAENDPDSCCAALEALGRIVELESSNGLRLPSDMILAHVHAVIISSSDAEVLSKAQSILAGHLTDATSRTAFFRMMSKDDITSTIQKLETQCLYGAPSNMQTALQLLGSFLDFAYHMHFNQETILTTISRYIRLLRMTIIDTNPFDMRFAAVQSVCALQYIWTASPTSKSTAPLLLGLAFVLHDLLNDDDDEIREAAASATHALFQAQNRNKSKHTVPILTDHRLVSWMPKAFGLSIPHLVTREALRRLTDTHHASKPLFSQPFEHMLRGARKEDTSLFATEKQNLYKDDVLDALAYSRILTALPRPGAGVLTLDMRAWVLAGLACLTAVAETERDGALGWASKPEVLTLCVRLVCMADVLLSWSGPQGKKDVLLAMRKFADLGVEKGEVHGLLIGRIERLLEREVLSMMSKVAGSMKMGEHVADNSR